MALQLHIDAPGLVPGQLRASFGGGHWEGREILFSRIPYLGGVSLAALRFGASFGPDRDKRCGRCRTGRLGWWGVFVANDDKGTRVPALRGVCIVVCFPHKRQAGGTNGKLGHKRKSWGPTYWGQSPAHCGLIIERVCGRVKREVSWWDGGPSAS